MENSVHFTTKNTARQILLQSIEEHIGGSSHRQDQLNQVFITRLLPVLEKFKSIGMYYPFSYEPNILRILPLLFQEKKVISFPWFDKKRVEFLQIYNLEVDLIPHTQIKDLRVPDPHLYRVDPEVILVPGIGYTQEKYRLGTGKGMYDRFLSTTKNLPISIGCFYSCSLCEFPKENHDIPLDIIVTDKKFL